MNAFDFLTPQRNPKTGTGITMMLDKGMGPVTVIAVSYTHLDVYKRQASC